MVLPPQLQAVADAVRKRSVAFVGFGFIGFAIGYATIIGGPASTLVLELLFPLTIGGALIWYGFDKSGRGTLERQEFIAACAVVGALLAAAVSFWSVYLHTIRIGYQGELAQQTLTAVSVGGGTGAVLGHAYAAFSRHYLAHERLSHAVDSSRDGIAIVERDSHAYVNDAYASLYGVEKPETLEGDEWYSLYTNAARVRIKREVIPALEDRDFWRGTLTGVRVDGSTFPQDVTVSTLEGDGYVVVIRDVSQQRDREQRIQVLNRVLRHNLRNAFTVIQGHANLMADRDEALETAHVEPIREEIANLLATADKARGVERTLARRSDRDLIAPSRAVRSVVDRAAAAHPKAAICSQVEESDVPSVASSVVDALDELVDNAVEHNRSADRPTVEVSVRTVDYGDTSRLEFTVADDGPGIPETERRAILEGRETQLDHGSGLGLWLVAWIVQSAGGNLRFADRPGGGSVVTLSFPVEGTHRVDDPRAAASTSSMAV